MSAWVLVKCNCPDRRPLRDSPRGPHGCGHDDGALVTTSPNDVIGYGFDLERIFEGRDDVFEVWRKISEWRTHSHRGDLHISPEEAGTWQREIELLQRFLSGEEFMGWHERQLWDRLREAERQSYARVESETMNEPAGVMKVLATGLALCRASQETGNPIEFSG